MSTLFPKKITYTDPGSGGYDSNGIWQDGVSEEKTFDGSVQPMSGKEVQSLPVGRQDTGKVKVYSNIELPISQQGGDNRGAIIQWNAMEWEVVFELINSNDLINHYKYVAEYRGKVS